MDTFFVPAAEAATTEGEAELCSKEEEGGGVFRWQGKEEGTVIHDK